MNWIPTANRDSLVSATAVAAYVAIMILTIALTWETVSGIIEQRASVSAARTMLAQLQGHFSSAPQPDGAPLAGAPTGSPFLEGQTLNVAGAALLQRVASVIQQVGGNVLSSQVDLDSDRAKDGWISLLVSCEVEQPSLQRLLYDVEAGMPFLFIDQLAAQGPVNGVNGGRMRLLLTVSGQWWKAK